MVEPRSRPRWPSTATRSRTAAIVADRLVASCLRLQSDHAGSAVSVATSDLNLQNKLAAVGMPFVEQS